MIHYIYRVVGIHLEDYELFRYFFTKSMEFKDRFVEKTGITEEQVMMYLDTDPTVNEFVDHMTESLYDEGFDIFDMFEKSEKFAKFEGLNLWRITHDVGDGFIIGLLLETIDARRGQEIYEHDLHEYAKNLMELNRKAALLLGEFPDISIKLYDVQDDCRCCS